MKRVILILSLAAAGLVPARAQLRLTLPEAVEIALSENPTIRVAELEVQRFDYVKRQTWGNLIPQISVGGTYTRSIVKQSMTKGLSFGADNTLTAQGDATWTLFAPTVFRTLRLNDTQMATAVEAARGSRITLVAEVKKAFYNILLSEQSLAVLRESEATVQRTVDDTELQYRNGLASEYDLLTAQVQLSNLRPSILQTENSIKVAKLLLKMYLSIPEEVEIEVAGELDAMRDRVLAGTDGLSTDITENSDLRTLELQEELLRRQLKVANASRWPTVAAFFSATYTGNDMDMTKLGAFGGGAEGGEGGSGSGSGSAGDVLDGSKFWWQHPISAGLQLNIPIFAGLTKMNRSRELKNQITQIGLQRDYARQQIDVEVRSALNDLLTARETMYAQERTVEQARKAYSISDTRYRAGAGTILELNSAQLAQTQAQLSYSQAIYDYLSAKAEYDRIVGREY
ncbi:TolC family protein [Alistipes sp.]|uniref:TolC family protein n=1 Tax=Alistipes sp. TaxID=1872444 RepID=UPI003AF11FCD